MGSNKAVSFLNFASSLYFSRKIEGINEVIVSFFLETKYVLISRADSINSFLKIEHSFTSIIFFKIKDRFLISDLASVASSEDRRIRQAFYQ